MPGYSSGATQGGEEYILTLYLHSIIAERQEDNGWMGLEGAEGGIQQARPA